MKSQTSRMISMASITLDRTIDQTKQCLLEFAAIHAANMAGNIKFLRDFFKKVVGGRHSRHINNSEWTYQSLSSMLHIADWRVGWLLYGTSTAKEH